MNHSVCPAPLTDAETMAALRAVGRVLDAARDRARWEADTETVADLLDRAGDLPEYVAHPELFRRRFRPALEGLAGRYDELTCVLVEFDAATAPAGRRPHPHPDLWRDCGAGD